MGPAPIEESATFSPNRSMRRAFVRSLRRKFTKKGTRNGVQIKKRRK